MRPPTHSRRGGSGGRKALLTVSLFLQLISVAIASSHRPSGPAPASGGGTECATDGSDYTYVETLSGTTRTVVTNHCPNHVYHNINPNYPIAGVTTYTMPASPMYDESAEVDLREQGGSVGVIFDGSQLYSAFAGPNFGYLTSYTNSAPYGEGDTFDLCGGHAAQTTVASYHIHIPPNCLLRQLGATDDAHSPQIGWAVDGFPVYGPRGPNGKMMKTCTVENVMPCLDDCGGLLDRDQTYLADGYKYRYYVQGPYTDGFVNTNPNVYGESEADYYPFTPPCYRGCCPTGVSCSNILNTCTGAAEVGYTAVRAAQAQLAVNPYPDGVTTAETAPTEAATPTAVTPTAAAPTAATPTAVTPTAAPPTAASPTEAPTTAVAPTKETTDAPTETPTAATPTSVPPTNAPPTAVAPTEETAVAPTEQTPTAATPTVAALTPAAPTSAAPSAAPQFFAATSTMVALVVVLSLALLW